MQMRIRSGGDQRVAACFITLLLSVPAVTLAQQIAIAEYPVPNRHVGMFGITAGPDGDLWFTEFGGNQIGRITTAGAIAEYPVPTAGSEPDPTTAGPDGALWFAEEFRAQIGRITTGGVITEYPLPNNASEPFGITAGPDGSCGLPNSISRRTRSGASPPAGSSPSIQCPPPGADPTRSRRGRTAPVVFGEPA